jgi:cholesterol oxidase
MRDLSTAMGARYVNPLWWLNLLVTVHPLGGCPMGADPEQGVVDSHGRVFGYPGLYVADGSVMPGPVGANPSLTIAALADRFADCLVEESRSRPGR